MSDLTIQSHTKSRSAISTLACTGMLCAIAYAVMFLSKTLFAPVAIMGFLKFDLKDVIIAIGGFLFGPLNALCISLVVSVIEMLTASSTGPIGLIMNVLSTIAFVCPAAFLYKKKHTFSAAAVGLVLGGLLMTATMLLWNYLITPLYMTYMTREEVAELLFPVFLPFNLLKAAMNGALTLLLYKPVVQALRKARLAPDSTSQQTAGKRRNVGMTIISLIVLTTAVLLGLVMAGVI